MSTYDAVFHHVLRHVDPELAHRVSFRGLQSLYAVCLLYTSDAADE